MNTQTETAVNRTCRRCGITIVGTGYACPGEPGELCSTHCLESAYEPPALGSVHEIQRTLDCLIRVPDKQPPLGDGDDSTRLVVPAHKMANLERELAAITAARDTALARVRELEAAMDELRRRLNALETDVYKYQNQCDPEEAIPAYITGEIERISKSASDAAARAAGTGEE